jgi:hypothetical protein
MATLTDEIRAYEAARSDLESKYLGRWVLMHDQQLIGTFPCFEAAADNAVRRFGRGPYLIRQVGAQSVTLPVSVLYNPLYGDDDMRVRQPR